MLNISPSVQHGISQHAKRQPRKRTISRQAQDWQFWNRNKLGRASECKVWNAVSHIQASGTHPTIGMVARLSRIDARQVRRILKRLERSKMLRWERARAKYQNNRLQWVPLTLNWDSLRKPEPTLPSTAEPTLAKSLGDNCFRKEIDITEQKPPVCVCPQEELPEEDFNKTPSRAISDRETYPENWATGWGFLMPERDIDAINGVLKSTRGGTLPNDLLEFMVQTIWLRATRPERHWKAFYAKAIGKILDSEGAFHSAVNGLERRNALYRKYRCEWGKPSDWPLDRLREYGARHTEGVSP